MKKSKAKKEKTNLISRPALNPRFLIEVKGLNQTRILNTLSKAGVTIKNLNKISGSVLRFCIFKKDLAAVKDKLESCGYQFAIIEEFSINAALRLLYKNIGLIAGIFLFTILALISNSFIWRVQISGNESIDAQLIARTLNENGIKQGVIKNKLDNDQIAAILRDMDGVAEGVAFVKGTTLFISIYESLDYIPPDDEQTPSDIISKYDAEITRIAVLNGVSNKKIGDKVAKGGVLIKGEIHNTLGEVINTCEAKGYVYGKVAFSENHIFSPIEEVLEYTNKQKTLTNFSIFGLKIGKKSLSGVEGWQTKTKRFSSFLLPIKFERTVFSEVKINARELDINAHIEKLKNEAILNNVIKAGGSEIETVATLTQIEGGLMRLNIYILAEILISET